MKLSELVAARGRPPVALLVEDSTTMTEFICHWLQDDFELVCVADGHAAMRALDENPNIDLLLLDYHLPDINGLTICKHVRQFHRFDNIPIVIITSAVEPEIEMACWEGGCSDFVTKPFVAHSLLQRVKAHARLKLAADELRNMAMVDSVTQVFNRRYLDTMMQQVSARGDTTAISMLIGDLDFFKRFNDAYGHLAGDACLRQSAVILQKQLRRPSDFVARYGGEEFVVVLPATDESGAQKVAQNIISGFEHADIEHKDSPFGRVTISIGGTTVDDTSSTWHQILEQADSQLYIAKSNGRNRVAHTTF